MDEDQDDDIRADEHATMDLSEHRRTWRLFVAFFKWHLAGLFVLLVLLLAFRTHG